MRGGIVLIVASVVVTTLLGAASASGPQEPAPFPADVAMRVESELLAAGDKPVARTFTLFHDGVAWDFLEMPVAPTAKGQPPAMKLVEIVLHDPVRERVVIIDPVRRVKTEISTVQLERPAAPTFPRVFTRKMTRSN
jgi:hypothetical protein